jgi:hypothetical protein
LVRGELAVEPVLGVVRVAAVRRVKRCYADCPAFVHVGWRDDHGPGSASVRYPADTSVQVYMPALSDRQLVRRGIDQAARYERVVSHDIARLMASHLHSGPANALHQFVIDGSVDRRVYAELALTTRQRRYAHEWVTVLMCYFRARADTGPVPAWAGQQMPDPEVRAKERLLSAGVQLDTLAQRTNGHRDYVPRRYATLLARKRMPTELAAQLIDAAFLLGAASVRNGDLVAVVEDRLQRSADASADR